LGVDGRWPSGARHRCGRAGAGAGAGVPSRVSGENDGVGGLAIAGVTTYAAVGDLAQNMLWRLAFQLTSKLAVYEIRSEMDRAIPFLWGHEEQRVSGTTSHVFGLRV